MNFVLATLKAPRSRGTTTRQTTLAYVSFSSANDLQVSAARVVVRVVPLINRCLVFSSATTESAPKTKTHASRLHSVSDLPTDTPRRQEKERERTNASSTPAGMSKSPAENTPSLDKTSALTVAGEKFLRAADEEQCTEAACHPVGERGRVRPELSFSAIGRLRNSANQEQSRRRGGQERREVLWRCATTARRASRKVPAHRSRFGQFQRSWFQTAELMRNRPGRRTTRTTKVAMGTTPRDRTRFSKPRPTWVARLPRPTSGSTTTKKRKERDQALNED